MSINRCSICEKKFSDWSLYHRHVTKRVCVPAYVPMDVVKKMSIVYRVEQRLGHLIIGG